MDTLNGTGLPADRHARRSSHLYQPQPWHRVWSLLVVWVLMIGCNLTAGPQTQDSDTTSVVQTSTAQAFRQTQEELSALRTQTAQATRSSTTPIPPLLSPTSVSTAMAAAATNTSLPELAVPPTPTALILTNEIHFRSGATSAYFQESIQAGDQHQYSVTTLEGQTLILTASSPNNDVYLDVKGQDGQQLLWAVSQTSYWFSILPTTQPYLITLTTNNPDTYYFLSVEVPANIHFKPGESSTTIDGFIDVDDRFHPGVITRVRYLAQASAGQTMTVELRSPNLDDLSLGIYGKDDRQAFIRYQVKNNGGQFEVPITQGYYLDVYATGGRSTAFTLEVSIK